MYRYKIKKNIFLYLFIYLVYVKIEYKWINNFMINLSVFEFVC